MWCVCVCVCVAHVWHACACVRGVYGRGDKPTVMRHRDRDSRNGHTLKRTIENSVSANPGDTTDTRMGVSTKSDCTARMNPSTANFDAQYTEPPGYVKCPEIDPIEIMCPDRRSRIPLAMAVVICMSPITLVRIIPSTSSGRVSSTYAKACSDCRGDIDSVNETDHRGVRKARDASRKIRQARRALVIQTDAMARGRQGLTGAMPRAFPALFTRMSMT